MKAVCWMGKEDVRVKDVAEPKILNPHDAILKVTTAAICGSDLHLYDGYVPLMREGDILGHEFVGEVVELGSAVTNLSVGDRVVVPFPISCGRCFFCKRQLFSLCDNTNPNAHLLDALYGASGAGIYGYSHLYGGYPGGQAQYVRVPFADVGPMKIPAGLRDEQVLFLSDVLPTGFMAAENCGIKPGDTVAVWGCGPVGLFAIQSAALLGASRIIAIDRVPERLELAGKIPNVEILNYEVSDTLETLELITGGMGPDACIDAVGMEAHGHSADYFMDRVKQSARMELDRANVLRQVVQACRKGGVVSIPGVYGGFIEKIPMGSAFAKGLTFRMGQTHVHRYLHPLLERITSGEINPEFIITHTVPLEEVPQMYRVFRDKEQRCVKVVVKP